MTLLVGGQLPFGWSSASLVGREHRRLGRNNQDALAVCCTGDLFAAVVADGCSAGRASEVGARLCSCWLARAAVRWAVLEGPRRDVEGPQLAQALIDRLLAELVRLRRWLEPVDAGCREVLDGNGDVAELLLCTVTVALVDPHQTLVFGVGDGVVCVNGKHQVRCDDAPAYLAYDLLATPPVRPTLTIHHQGLTRELHSLCIGSDGLAPVLGDLPVLLDGSHANPTLLTRRLRALDQREHCLHDDASLIAIARVNA